MITVKILDKNINIPQSWYDVDIKTQKRITTSKNQLVILANLLNVDKQQLADLPQSIANKILDELRWFEEEIPSLEDLPKVKIDGKEYEITFTNMCLGAWIDVEHLQKNMNQNIDKIVTILCKPNNVSYSKEQEWQKLSQKIELNAVEIQTISFFFRNMKTVSNLALKRYTELINPTK